jgi:NADH-quinone oxidoreductase subunit J
VAADGTTQGSLSAVGMALFGPFALPFEMASLVLLAAIIGAVVLARRRAPGS